MTCDSLYTHYRRHLIFFCFFIYLSSPYSSTPSHLHSPPPSAHANCSLPSSSSLPFFLPLRLLLISPSDVLCNTPLHVLIVPYCLIFHCLLHFNHFDQSKPKFYYSKPFCYNLNRYNIIIASLIS